MTQRQISHPEGLPACSAGHSARHIHDQRSAAAGGGHFIECRCKSTIKKADPNAAMAEWRKLNRPARAPRKKNVVMDTCNVLQMPLRLAETGGTQGRPHGSR